MFQNFDSPRSIDQSPKRLRMLRAWMLTQELDGFLVPRTDRHQGENVAARDERLSWLTGFTGSAGFACILPDQAGIFIDTRYRLQVFEQVTDQFTPVHWPETQLQDWLKSTLISGTVVGFDPWLHTVAQIETLRQTLTDANITLKSCPNGVDTIWKNKPAPPVAKAWLHPDILSGEASAEKCLRIGEAISEIGADRAVITLPDSLCWLLNIRGGDVPRTPIVQCFAVISRKGNVTLFCDTPKLSQLNLNANVKLLDWSKFAPCLKSLKGQTLIDPSSMPQAAMEALELGTSKIIKSSDPCTLPKARKNGVELAGARAAHLRDGAAIVEFLAWFDTADKSDLTEIDIVKKLEDFRTATNLLHDISFDTISGSGPNGAIVHYRVTHDSNRKLDINSLLLIDSGAQYHDGTTDITRTLPLGHPSLDMRQAFTRVLQGMINVSKVRFPKGLTGRDLDALARVQLWAAGQDYDHGTGHGVGSFLSVHEGPQRISRTTDVQLEPGMLLSNEPGYYRTGAFGIRIENLLVVQPAANLPDGDNRPMLEFETITYAPIDRRLIEATMLTQQEKTWLNNYQKAVYHKLSQLIKPSSRRWLAQATVAI